jgi:carboxypeptidase family protein
VIRRSRIVVVVVAVAAWWIIGRLRSSAPAVPPESAAASAPLAPAPHAAPRPERPSAAAPTRVHPPALPFASPYAAGEVTITGRVVDVRAQAPVGNVEVVFHSASGDSSTTTAADGTYAIEVATGMYRAFVRDDTVLSVGRPDLVRVPGQPVAEAAGVPDEALMPMVLATRDTDGVDLTVVRGGIVSGRVVDRGGRPIAGAVLRARGGDVRPALATDIAETDRDGSFELRLPAGAFELDANHPRFAGVADLVGTGVGSSRSRIAVAPGDHLRTTITLTAGCVISGRVIRPDGTPAGDGAIERQWGEGDYQFAPSGRIEPDGTFRWVTTDELDVTIRAWPWKSPPSPSQRFTCRDGARFDNVVLQLTDQRPDLAGVLVDASGAAVGLAYVDVQPLDPGGIGQQERTGADGRWEVYHLPPGHYRVVAQAAGRGILSQAVTAPAQGLQLTLGGTGRLEGAVAGLTSGSIELELGTCLDGDRLISLPQSHRLITVTAGRFTVDDLPACELMFGVVWHGQPIAQRAAIPSGGTAHLDLDLAGPQRRGTTVHEAPADPPGGQPEGDVEIDD